MSFEQILEAGPAKPSTIVSPSTDNELQDALTRAQQAISSAANEVTQDSELDSLPQPETEDSQMHNQSQSFARTVGQFVGHLQNEVMCVTTFTRFWFVQKQSA